jgi:DNA-binding MarR family transcriptional regulator
MKTVTDHVAVANELRPVLLRLARQLRRELHEADVTAGQATVLTQIANRPGVGIRELARLDGVSQPRMSKVVQDMLVAGLLVRNEGEDRRRVGLELTPRGAEVVESVRKARTAWLAGRLEQLAPAELERLHDALPLLERLIEESA